MRRYRNAQGVMIQAGLIEDEADEYYGCYLVIDASGNQGRITAQQFAENWTPVEEPIPPDVKGKGKP